MVLLSNWASRFREIWTFLIPAHSDSLRNKALKPSPQSKILNIEDSLAELSEKNRFLVQQLLSHGIGYTDGRLKSANHDIANALTNIHLAISQLSDDFNINESNLYFRIINRNSVRIQYAIKEFMQHPVFSEMELKRVRINELIEDSITPIISEENLYGKGIVSDLTLQNPEIRVDPMQLKAAFASILATYISFTELSGQKLLINTTMHDGICVVQFRNIRGAKTSILKFNYRLLKRKTAAFENVFDFPKTIILCNQGTFKLVRKANSEIVITIHFDCLSPE